MSYLIYIYAYPPSLPVAKMGVCKQDNIKIKKVKKGYLVFLAHLNGKAYILTSHNHS